jgi:hypothetical protein
MKGFSEFRGQMFRMSFDPVSGEFLNVAIPQDIARIFSTDVTAHKTAENFKPKIVSRTEIKTPSIPTRVIRKKRA